MAIIKLLTEHHFEFLSLKGGWPAQALLSLHLSKCNIVEKRMSHLNFSFYMSVSGPTEH